MGTPTRIALAGALVLLMAGLFVLAFLFGGAGHGSAFFYLALSAPFSLFGGSIWYALAAMLLWLAVALLLPFLRTSSARIAVVSLLLAHYVGVAIVALRGSDWQYVGHVWQSVPWLLLLFITGYLAVQVIIWFLIARRHDLA